MKLEHLWNCFPGNAIYRTTVRQTGQRTASLQAVTARVLSAFAVVSALGTLGAQCQLSSYILERALYL